MDNWKGPWAGYEGEKVDRMTSEEKVCIVFDFDFREK